MCATEQLYASVNNGQCVCLTLEDINNRSASSCLPAVRQGVEWHMVQPVAVTVLRKQCVHEIPATAGPL